MIYRMRMPVRPSFSELKLRSLSIRNYKRIDTLNLEFPEPRMKNDPDVIVLGSENGGGKTSVLECIGLLYLAGLFGAARLNSAYFASNTLPELDDLLIRAGKSKAEIEGTFEIQGQSITIQLRLCSEPQAESDLFESEGLFQRWLFTRTPNREIQAALSRLLGIKRDPLLLPSFVYFNSYRKILEGYLDLESVTSSGSSGRVQGLRVPRSNFGIFKAEMLRAMLDQTQLFEHSDKERAESTIRFLNDLVSTYAGGTITKLKPLPDNTFDFRVIPKGGKTSFAFDGLSSGQKEIISTLFLIWHSTHQKDLQTPSPALVLIDEPELHLNAGWHAGLVRRLHKLGPQNQYILATHSEDVVDSVDPSRRILLEKSK